MFTHYLKAALRNLRRSKLDGAINILGLSFGLAAAILILLFVRDETSYDDFWPDIGRVYRLETNFTLEGRPDLNTVLAMGPAKAAFERYFAGDVESVARMNRRTPVVTRGADVFTDHVILADPEILDIFPLEPVTGDPRAALADPHSIIVTETFARKYFGDADPMGQTMTLTQSGAADDYTVAAVVRDLPANTHIELNAIIPVDEVRFQVTPWLFDSWYAVNNHTYVKLRPGVDVNDVRARLNDFTNAEVPADEGQSTDFVTFRLTPVRDIHLNATGIGEMKPRGDARIVLAFAAIAFLIVAVAAVNFVNLATARAGLRAREVALRKVVGAGRSELIRQHLAESLFVTGLATVLALGLVELLLPAANGLLGKSLTSPLAAPEDMALIALAWLTVAFLSGLYPAYLISGFRPGPQLHGTEVKVSGHAGWGRNLMVAFQSAVTISLIAATGVVAAQLNLFRSLDKGFDENGLIALHGTFREGVGDNRDALKAEVEALPMVTSTAYVSETPGSPNEMNTTVRRPGEVKLITIGEIQVDHDFFKTLDIKVLAGRDYDRAHAMDRDPVTEDAVAGGRYPANVLINRLAARTLGFANPEGAIGQHMVASVLNTDDGEIEGDLTIVGVTGDLYFHTVKREQRPEMYRIGELRNGLMVRYTGDSKSAMAALEGVWKRIAPTVPFTAEFVDQAMAAELDSERVQMQLFSAFAALTIIIAALGLYGLAAFSAERRTKEIGIRRVLGARVADVFRLMLWQFSKPVIVAILVASPVAAYLMLGWLEKFPYRIAAPEVAGYVALAGVAALLIAWATVSSLTIRVARANPVHALKHE